MIPADGRSRLVDVLAEVLADGLAVILLGLVVAGLVWWAMA